MTKDEINKIIFDNELFHGTVGIGVVMDIEHLEKFAELVSAAEREAFRVRRWTKEMDIAWHRAIPDLDLAFAELIRARGQE